MKAFAYLFSLLFIVALALYTIGVVFHFSPAYAGGLVIFWTGVGIVWGLLFGNWLQSNGQ